MSKCVGHLKSNHMSKLRGHEVMAGVGTEVSSR